jgi:Putative transposase
LQALAKNRNFFSWLNEIMRSEWVVYAKPPFGGPQQVLKYLARYTHRVAISNRRLVALQNGSVTFRWKDYAKQNQSALMTLDATEFIRRFLLHVLPKGLVRIRHFGFLANRCRRQKISLCRKLLDVALPSKPQGSNPRDDSLATEQETKPIDRCPVCRVGHLRPLEILLPQASVLARHRARLVVAVLETDTS